MSKIAVVGAGKTGRGFIGRLLAEDGCEFLLIDKQEELVQKGKEELENLGFENVTDEQASNFFNNKVIFEYADKGERSPAFDYKSVLSTTVITINTSHKFYTSFLSKLYNSPDAKTTFELFLASFFQSIRKTNAYQSEQNDKLMTIWYNKLNNYITEQLNPRK